MIAASLVLQVLQHGAKDRMDLIYFWSSLFMVLLPLAIFSTLTYMIVNAYRKRERSEHLPH
ncbi:MAG TPA: hypothetical protein VN908_11140 [Gemmatimonadales bacterium]|nr:hypothetical protein [Gemmatimonadales bacterium]